MFKGLSQNSVETESFKSSLEYILKVSAEEDRNLVTIKNRSRNTITHER